MGGCIRKIINKEKVDDIDFATNLEPKQVCEALKKNDISYFESGIDHGTITAIDDEFKFEITSLRKDIFTDGRHAKVEFSKDWKEDASRRDFTINSIYSDLNGNIFDPQNGKNDLKNKIGGFCGVNSDAVIASLDADSIYSVPLALKDEGLCKEVLDCLDLDDHESDLKDWERLVHKLRNPGPSVKVALVGK